MANGSVIPLFNILSGAVALLISYYAYKNNKLVGSSLLRYISGGFLLLGFGLFLEAGTEITAGLTIVDAVNLRGATLLEFLVSTALQLVAYAVFAWGYGLSAFRRGDPQVPQAAPAGALPVAIETLSRRLLDVAFILAIFLASQFGIIVLLLFIVYHGTRVFSKTKSNLALMVLFGFTLILASRALLFVAALYVSSGLLLVGDTIQLCGFLSLLFFLYWSARVVK